MPIRVDREERRQQIIDAALLELGETGITAFSLKGVGARLGGSVTLITHYFASRTELFAASLEQVISDAELFRDELEQETDADARLTRMISYFIPDTPEELAVERARVALSSHAVSDPEVHRMFERLDPSMRAVVLAGLRPKFPPALQQVAVDLVRVWSSGLVLLMVEQPGGWNADRREIALRSLLVSLESLSDGGLSVVGGSSRAVGAGRGSA